MSKSPRMDKEKTLNRNTPAPDWRAPTVEMTVIPPDTPTASEASSLPAEHHRPARRRRRWQAVTVGLVGLALAAGTVSAFAQTTANQQTHPGVRRDAAGADRGATSTVVPVGNGHTGNAVVAPGTAASPPPSQAANPVAPKTANLVPAVAAAIPSTTNYPWAGLTWTSGGDQWGMAYGQCVSYAAWMIYQNFGGSQHPPYIPDRGWFPSDGLARGPVRYSWGNAGDWNVSAARAGYPVNGTPHVGAIAQWVNGGDIGQFKVGHVAYVTAVNPDGSIDLAQYNLREDSRFSTLHMTRSGAWDTSNNHGRFFVSWPDHFLHIGDAGIGSTGGMPYQVTDKVDAQGLAVQSVPHINHVVRWVGAGTTLYVVCQTRFGDQVDGKVWAGKPFTTWDKLADGTWVYDWYMNTPTVAASGYSPGINPCPGG